MEFIKIGDEFLVKANITSFKFFPEGAVVRAYTTDGKASEFRGAEAALLLEYLNSPDRTYRINPSEKIGAYQDYRERGGDALFADWQLKFDYHHELSKIKDPDKTRLDVIRDLEDWLRI